MQDKYDITDAELEIMQILWENKKCDLNTIIETINGNKNTIKTLLRRLILKGSVESKKIGLKDTVLFDLLLQYIVDITGREFSAENVIKFLKSEKASWNLTLTD